ncbi:MAG: hypothetical protein OXI87_01815 [Albidovulum sp.]|nr:hypothetical protein [Albidovulum sp.]MDE0303610.1 hypothetical protein [Albidovulum sp.]MDE0533112.1 hypothetical protein [Albidovulum sp.]
MPKKTAWQKIAEARAEVARPPAEPASESRSHLNSVPIPPPPADAIEAHGSLPAFPASSHPQAQDRA